MRSRTAIFSIRIYGDEIEIYELLSLRFYCRVVLLLLAGVKKITDVFVTETLRLNALSSPVSVYFEFIYLIFFSIVCEVLSRYVSKMSDLCVKIIEFVKQIEFDIFYECKN